MIYIVLILYLLGYMLAISLINSNVVMVSWKNPMLHLLSIFWPFTAVVSFYLMVYNYFKDARKGG